MSEVLDLVRDRDLPRRPVPDHVEPMLATLVDEPFSDPDWIFERKLDGERCLAFGDDGEVGLRSRNRRRLDDTYPELLEPLSRCASSSFVIDGEIVAFEGRRTSFQRLQKRMQIDDRECARRSGVGIVYYLFDVLHLDGRDTTDLPLRHRKRVLLAMFEYADPLRFAAHRNEDGEAFFSVACERGWEGLIAKDATARYVHGRSRRWLKLKCVARQEFVVGGFTDPQGSRVGFGALLVGYHEKGRLVYAGKVGTGFDDETLRRLGDRMDRLERQTSPFDRGDTPTDGVHWTTPELVVELGFTEWTSGGKLRHPRYVGLRRDKDPSGVVREVPS